MTVKQLKMWSRETVRRNQIEPAETENLSNSQKCLITLHIVGWVIIRNIISSASCRFGSNPEHGKVFLFIEIRPYLLITYHKILIIDMHEMVP